MFGMINLGRRLFNNEEEDKDVALVINWSFHKQGKWVSIFAPNLVDAFLSQFDPIIIESQRDYDRNKRRLKFIFSMEPGWAAPTLRYDPSAGHVVGVMASDPHNKVGWFQKYVEENHINLVFSQYYSPFVHHFPSFPLEKLVHFPWAVPDRYMTEGDVDVYNNRVAAFGARNSGAYDIRNWCKEQDGVERFDHSGVENKRFTDDEYFCWMKNYGAIIAAGSSRPEFDLVTPKYFEIPSSGALLFGQQCKDLARLGFDESNMLIFNKRDFLDKLKLFKRAPERYHELRKAGRSLVRDRHLISNRIELIGKHINEARSLGA